MKKPITPQPFEPGWQPNQEQKASFLLRPLDMPTYWAVQASIVNGGKLPTWDGMAAAFAFSVIEWSGIVRDGAPLPFSRESKKGALEEYDRDFAVWIAEIGAHLYLQSVLGETERKNS